MQVPQLPALAAGASGLVGRGVLTIASAQWRPTRWWDPRPRVEATALRGAGRRLLRTVSSRSADSIGVPFRSALDASRGLARADARGAIAILGLGPGFTPAGDDVVAGSLAVLALTHRLAYVARDQVLSAAADRTTSLSVALLRCAAAGQVVPAAAQLLIAATTGTDDDIATATTALYAVGSTSGAALAFGMATALGAAQTLEMETT